MKNNIRFAWLGFHFEGYAALMQLVSEKKYPVAILTLTKELIVKRSGGFNVEEFLHRYGIPIYYIENINDNNAVDLIKSLDLDVLFVIGWSQIVRIPALSSVKIGMIGAHASLLPHNRGSAPINWAIIKGELCTGNSLIWLSDGVDNGDIIDQQRFDITPYDTCKTLYDKVSLSNAIMISKVLPLLEKGEIPGRKQEHSNEDILPRRRPSDGEIDWSCSSLQIYDFVRALSRPYPGAFSYMNGKRVKIWKSSLLPGNPYPDVKCGNVIGPVFSTDVLSCGQIISCGDGAIIINEIEDEIGEVFYGPSISELKWNKNKFGKL